VLINLVPEFLAVLDAADREAAYRHYFESHKPFLSAYWQNYVLDPESPTAHDVVLRALSADRSDLRALLSTVDVVPVVEEALARAEDLLGVDRPTDCYLMVGMGAANAGARDRRRGVIFICLDASPAGPAPIPTDRLSRT
jgi:hypothetical protein